MQRHYDGEWLLIAYTELNENMEVVAGEVLAHSPHQEDIYQTLELVKEQPVAIEYVGKIPEDLGSMLGKLR